MDEIENLRSQVASLAPETLIQRSRSLSTSRILSSTTLRKSGHESWETANLFIAEKIQQEVELNWDHICQLNQILAPEKHGEIRQGSVFIGHHQAPNGLAFLNKLQWLQMHLNPKPHEHPLLHASTIRYELVTLHPFNDGNGRTSNLVCDWLLGRAGYLPLSYTSKVDGLIGGWENRKSYSTLEFAVEKTLLSVLHSYHVILQSHH